MHAQRHTLPQGRLHFQHGPIDLVIGAEGQAHAVAAAHDAAWHRFQTVLVELVAELPQLRRPVQSTCLLQGPIAQTMWQACYPYRDPFITAMAAVAGAVAQTVVTAYHRPGITRAWVNNGGDIALHLTPRHVAQIGLYADVARLDARQIQEGVELDGRFTVTHDSGIRGVATSGWRGRSFSLGIADSVTVLAATAAQADAAATVIANAVNVEHPAICRQPACTIKDDSDLGSIAVTVDVPTLPAETVAAALDAGLACAHNLQHNGLIVASVIVCQGRIVSTLGDVANAVPLSSLCQEPA